MGLHNYVVPIMGIPVRFSSADEELLRAAAEGFDIWRSGPMRVPERQVEVRLSVLAASPFGSDDPQVEVMGGLLRMTGRGVRAEADAAAEFAHCAVVAEYLCDPGRLAWEVLDTLVLFLLTRRGRVPIHAAGAVAGSAAVLLAGPSGVGKSTLALAAVEAGFRLLSDDAVYVQTEPFLRVWGYPRPIRIADPADSLGRPAGERIRRRGRWKSSVHLSPDEIALHADWPILCLVIRDREASPRRISSGEARARLMNTLDPGFDHFREALPAVLDWVAGEGAWELPVSRDSEKNGLLLRGVLEGAAKV